MSKLRKSTGELSICIWGVAGDWRWTQLITVPILLSPAPCPGQVTPSPSLTQTTGHTQTGDTPGYVAKSFLSKSYFYDPLQIGECIA